MPIILASLLFALTYGTTLDFAFASFLYELQGGAWSLQHHWLTEIVLHKYVRDLNQILLVLLLGYWLVRQFYRKDRSQKQRALGGLLLSLILSYIIVAILKRLLPMECPWDLQQFGGNSVFWGLFDSRPASLATNQCFPAGHSSIGFAWIALYYYLRQVQPSRAFQGLLLGLSAGLLLGFVQQLRGAHFISHDIATATICWLVSTFQYLFQSRCFAKTPLALVDTLPSPVPVLTFTSVESADV
jgi:membrane-associated PAP2 superfamily phosphatase